MEDVQGGTPDAGSTLERAAVQPAPAAGGVETMRSIWKALLGDAPLGDSLQHELVEGARLDDAASGDLLLSCRDEASHLVLLARGDAVVGTVPPSGGPFLTERSVSAPAWVDAASAWRGGRYLHDVQANSHALVVRLPIEAARRMVSEHPAFALAMLEVLADQIDQLGHVTRDLLQKDAEARFAVWLVQRLPEVAAGHNTAVVVLAERKRDIAAQLGITPETLSRLQRGLARKGVIEVVGYSVRVLDVATLRHLAGQ